MKDENLVSIIVPIYNVKDYIEQCVHTILTQTYEKLEILLIDDGSTDGSGEICEKLTEIDGRVRVIHKKNGGLSDARNVGIKESKGSYLSFVDGDDLLHPQAIEIMLDNLRLNDADISEGGLKREHEISFEQFKNVKYKNEIHSFTRTQALIELYSKARYLHVMAWAKLYKKELFEKISFPKDLIHEDMAIMYLLYENAKRIVATTAPVYYQNERDGSITRSGYNRFRMYCWCKHYFEALHYYRLYDKKIFSAVQAGYLRDAIRYWKISYEAKDFKVQKIIMRCYRKCINHDSMKYYSIKGKVKIFLFAVFPKILP